MSADHPVPETPIPDGKDWTWVLDDVCAECGFDAARVDLAALPTDIAAATSTVARAAIGPDGTRRPRPDVWSPLEYACHVRDVCTVFRERVELMQHQDDPQFANWDQDETALAERYWEQDPTVVAEQLATTASQVAATFAGVGEDAWTRPGRRSNGSVFTVDTIARYFLHDLIHHAHDVRRGAGAPTDTA